MFLYVFHCWTIPQKRSYVNPQELALTYFQVTGPGVINSFLQRGGSGKMECLWSLILHRRRITVILALLDCIQWILVSKLQDICIKFLKVRWHINHTERFITFSSKFMVFLWWHAFVCYIATYFLTLVLGATPRQQRTKTMPETQIAYFQKSVNFCFVMLCLFLFCFVLVKKECCVYSVFKIRMKTLFQIALFP